MKLSRTFVTFDGKAADTMTLQALRELFYGVPGTTIHLGVLSREGTQRSVVLTLGDYV